MRPIIDRWMQLSKELKVAVTIQKMTEMGEVPYFTSIWETINKIDDFPKTSLHNALDNLTDIGQIEGQTEDDAWQKVGDKWVRGFSIVGPGKEFIEKLTREVYY